MNKQLLQNYLLLVAGLLLFLISNGKWIVPVAIWISLALLLRFFRTQKSLWNILIGAIAYIGIYCIQWHGLIKFEGVIFYAIAGGIGLAFFIPIAIDKIISPRVSGFAATLVFPLAWTTIEFIGFKFTPFGTWGSLAYTQYGNLPLMQIVNITGIYGITFLIAWFASVVNWVWEENFEWIKINNGIKKYISIMFVVLLYGGVCLIFLSPQSNEVKVAGVQSHKAEVILAPIVEKFNAGDFSMEVWKDYFAKTNIIIDDLFTKSEIAAKNGAKIISWSENPVMISENDEELFIKRGADFSQKEQVYLALNYSINLSDDIRKAPAEKFWSAKTVLVGPNGKILSTYRKTILVPGFESTIAVSGNDDVTIVDTPYGRISSLICFDNDFPAFVRKQVGGNRSDIHLVPSGDWKEIDPYHTNMIAFRAIENGFSVFRVTFLGLSAAYDYQGRTLATMDYFKTGDKVFTAHIPENGTKTLYSQIGDVFAWLVVAGLIGITGFSFYKKQSTTPRQADRVVD